MVQLIGSLLASLTILFALSGQSVADTRELRPSAAGWLLEQDVEAPSYALTEPASTNLNIDNFVLSCEQGPHRRGLQLRVYLKESGPLAPPGAGNLKDDPTVELFIDDAKHPAQLLFADDFVVVADSADGVMPLLSNTLLDALQEGQRMELRFHLLEASPGQTPTFDSKAVVDLQAGAGGAAIAALRRCADDRNPQFAQTTGRAR
jgi:hypothetical protein